MNYFAGTIETLEDRDTIVFLLVLTLRLSKWLWLQEIQHRICHFGFRGG